MCLLQKAGTVIVSCGQGCSKILTLLSRSHTLLLLYLSIIVVPSYYPSLSLAQPLSVSVSLTHSLSLSVTCFGTLSYTFVFLLNIKDICYLTTLKQNRLLCN